MYTSRSPTSRLTIYLLSSQPTPLLSSWCMFNHGRSLPRHQSRLGTSTAALVLRHLREVNPPSLYTNQDETLTSCATAPSCRRATASQAKDVCSPPPQPKAKRMCYCILQQTADHDDAVIKMGLFDKIPAPVVEVYTKNRQEWEPKIEGTGQFETSPSAA